MSCRAVFLDRDGTLNRPAAPGDYITEPSALRLLDGADQAVARLHDAGYVCVVVSNQRGVSLGRMTGAQLVAVDERLRELVAVDHSYYCIHGLDDRCACRKPEPGLLIRAGVELELDLTSSWMIGDRETDCEAGRRAGCRTIQVQPQDGALLSAVHSITSA